MTTALDRYVTLVREYRALKAEVVELRRNNARMLRERDRRAIVIAPPTVVNESRELADCRARCKQLERERDEAMGEADSARIYIWQRLPWRGYAS